jgi:hypothetical protein
MGFEEGDRVSLEGMKELFPHSPSGAERNHCIGQDSNLFGDCTVRSQDQLLTVYLFSDVAVRRNPMAINTSH